jgi:hypothetical protein
MYDSPAFIDIMGKLGRIAEDTDRKISSFYEGYTKNENLMRLLNRSIDPLISLSRVYSRRISDTPFIDVIERWNSSVAEARKKETNYSKFATDDGVRVARAQLSSHQNERKFRDMDRTRLIMQRLGIDPESDPSLKKVTMSTELGALKRERASHVEQKKKLEQEIQLISKYLIDITERMRNFISSSNSTEELLDSTEADLDALTLQKKRIERSIKNNPAFESEWIDITGKIRDQKREIRDLKKIIKYKNGQITQDQQTLSVKGDVKKEKKDAVKAIQNRIKEIDNRIEEIQKSLGDDSEIDIGTVLNPTLSRQEESLSFEDYAYLMTEGFFGGSSSRPRSNSAWIKEPNLRKLVLEFLHRLDEELPVEDFSIEKSFLSRVGSKFTTPLEKRKLNTNEIIFFKKLKRSVQDSIRIVNSI